jgi:hypothetical protein
MKQVRTKLQRAVKKESTPEDEVSRGIAASSSAASGVA